MKQHEKPSRPGLSSHDTFFRVMSPFPPSDARGCVAVGCLTGCLGQLMFQTCRPVGVDQNGIGDLVGHPKIPVKQEPVSILQDEEVRNRTLIPQGLQPWNIMKPWVHCPMLEGFYGVQGAKGPFCRHLPSQGGPSKATMLCVTEFLELAETTNLSFLTPFI